MEEMKIDPGTFGRFWLPENVSAHGGSIDLLMILLHVFMFVLFIGWGIYFVYVLLRFRKRDGVKAHYEPIKAKSSKYVEAAVVLIEVVLLLGLSMPIWADYKTIPQSGVDFAEGSAPTEVHVVAEQFIWNFHYPGADGKFGKMHPEKVESDSNPLGLDRKGDPDAADDIAPMAIAQNTLVVPIGRPVIARITSKDVIHSFALPNFRVKQDAVPGLEIPVHFVPTKIGRYEVACAQLCGNSHSKMRGVIDVLSEEDYAKWIAENSPKVKKAAPVAAAPAAAPEAAPAAASAPAAAAPAAAADLAPLADDAESFDN